MPINRILVLHNRYRKPGGEDQVFDQEVALLRERGHTVFEYVDTNERLDDSRLFSIGLEAIWSRSTVRRLEQLIADTQPDLAHFHNTFARISPSAYYACGRAGIPVVQTLHNFRLGCVNACCTLNGRPCQTCVGLPLAWPGILRGCYRESRAASAAVAGITALHKVMGTYRRQVDAYVSLSEFAREIHLRSGVPPHLSHVKPNFSADALAAESPREAFALYAGRMIRDKGVDVLLTAWKKLNPGLRLKLAGDGPDAAYLRSLASDLPEVEFLGPLPHSRIRELMTRADFFIQPSLLLENCSLVLIEALAAGLPSVVSGHGSFPEIVEDGRSGLHFQPGDANDLAAKIEWMRMHPAETRRMGRTARARYEAHYSPDKNYAQLVSIYEAARNHRALAAGARA